ncbi:tetratricopeptide repeat protein [Streptomyces sp. NPDC058525]|uniref:tetratricopeptide repeat protein n=1 Tax=Streptomyces sp. NPDC058525 TaxID=3346538 RepID=UPI003669A922
MTDHQRGPGDERELGEARRDADEYRLRAREDPDLHLPGFALCLYRLGALLMERAERHEEAAEVLDEAVEVTRRLAAANPHGWLPTLAMTLDQRALLMGILGRRARAGALAAEATDLYRGLARQDPERHLPGLAAALTNLGNQLAELGQHHEALDRMREGVEVRRTLAARQPDGGGAAGLELASALVELGVKLGEMGHHEEAADVLRDAVGRYRARIDSPAAPAPAAKELADHWVALVTLARELTALGLGDETEPYRTQAASVHRRLARTSPHFLAFVTAVARRGGITVGEDGRFEQASRPASGPPRAAAPDPAVLARVRNLNEQGLRLASAGSLDLAVGMLRDAVDLSRRTAATAPGLSIALARSLHNLGLAEAWSGHRAEALAAADEAVHLYRRAVEAAPGPVRPLLADSLDSLGSRLAALGRHHDALVPARESVRVHRQLAREDPTARLPELARALNNLGVRLTDAGLHEESLAVAREVVDLYRRIQASGSGMTGGTGTADTDHLSGLIHGLSNLGLRLARAGYDEEVAAPTLQAVELLSGLTRIHPGNDVAALADSLAWLGHHLGRTGHRREGRAATRAAEDLRRRSAVRR